MFQRFKYSLQRFMYGRYGSDTLNLVLLIGGLALSLITSLLAEIAQYNNLQGLLYISLFLQLASQGLLIWALVRAFSRNVAARRRENQRFTQFWRKLTDRKNRYYRCPRCRQTVRVPRGRGKICIKCPKCGEKFIRKS